MTRTAIAFLFLTAPLLAADPVVVDVWPGKAPGETGEIGEEKDQLPKPGDAKPVIRTTNVTHPTLTVMRPPKEKDTGAAVVICPGGGYNILAWDLEGTEVAEWLNGLGVTGIVLKYRVPRREGVEKHAVPLKDAQRAMRVARSRAKEWGIDPERIGILGFSAGGHLAATASTNYDRPAYEAIDAVDEASARPDFTVLVYPAYMVNEAGNGLDPLFRVTKETPPVFCAHAYDDRVTPLSSVYYFLAAKKLGVPAELHVYGSGGHGFGLRKSSHTASTSWPVRCGEWLKARGLLDAKK